MQSPDNSKYIGYIYKNIGRSRFYDEKVSSVMKTKKWPELFGPIFQQHKLMFLHCIQPYRLADPEAET